MKKLFVACRKRIFDNLKDNDILKSSAGLVVITLLVKVFGYVEKMVLANYYGTSYQVDVYIVVLTLVLSIFFFCREIVEPAFLNTFLDARIKGDVSGSWNIFNKGIRLILLVTLIISLFLFLFPSRFTKIFAPGFEGEKLVLSETLIRTAIPACIFLALSTLTSITLNGLKKFVLPASGELAFKAAIIICMVLFFESYGIIGATIGVVIGSVARFGVHLTKLHPQISFRRINLETKYKRRIWQLTWPLLTGMGFSQISSLIDNIFASYLQEGAIAALSYARKIVELPVIIFPYVISVVAFPYFSQLAIEKQKEKLKSILAGLFKWIIIGFLPIAAFFFVYAIPIVEIIFQRGAFNAGSTLLTSKPLMVYSVGMVFFAIETILVIFYYSNADTKTPVFVGMVCVALNILLTWFFIQIIGYIGIALAFVIQKAVKNLILLYWLKNKITYKLKSVLKVFFKIVITSAVFLTLITVAKTFVYYKFNESLIGKIGFLTLTFVFAGSIYLYILYRWGLLNINGDKIRV
jgi:putative peptidoglycan lipid II flippase